MSTTQIREALEQVRESLEVPEVDQVAFQARVRAERRRHRAVRGGIAVAGVVAASVAVLALAPALRDVPTATDDSNGLAAGPVAEPVQLVGFVVNGKLVVGGPGGFHPTDVPARIVLGMMDDRIVLVDGTGALVGVPVDDDGVPSAPVRLRPGVVDYAWLDESTEELTVQDSDGTLVSRGARIDAWTALTAVRARTNVFLIADGARVESSSDGLVLKNGDLVKPLSDGQGITGGDLQGDVVALETLKGGARFYDTSTGERLAAVAGEGSGRLGPDGGRYARVDEDGLSIIDTGTGAAVQLAGARSWQGDVEWTSDDTVVAVSRDENEGTSLLWECQVDRRECARVYVDPTGTLQLHS